MRCHHLYFFLFSRIQIKVKESGLIETIICFYDHLKYKATNKLMGGFSKDFCSDFYRWINYAKCVANLQQDIILALSLVKDVRYAIFFITYQFYINITSAKLALRLVLALELLSTSAKTSTTLELPSTLRLALELSSTLRPALPLASLSFTTISTELTTNLLHQSYFECFS